MRSVNKVGYLNTTGSYNVSVLLLDINHKPVSVFFLRDNNKLLLHTSVMVIGTINGFLPQRWCTHLYLCSKRAEATPGFVRCCHVARMLQIHVCTIVFLPPAAVSCGAPSAPVNGGVLATDYSVGTRVTYFCNGGYRLSSKELTTTVCQPDSTWSNHNKIPRCIGKKQMRCWKAAG